MQEKSLIHIGNEVYLRVVSKPTLVTMYGFETISLTPKEYKVLSVIPYIEVDTNGYGAVLSQDLGYAFTYIDENGVLHNDTIYHTEYGIWKVCIGEENKYIVEDKGFDTYRYLYLTEETLRNMSGLGVRSE